MDNLISNSGDDLGNLWIGSIAGFQSETRFDRVADGRTNRVNAVPYGEPDGMLAEKPTECQPAGYRTGDGRLWFPTIRVVVVDP